MNVGIWESGKRCHESGWYIANSGQYSQLRPGFLLRLGCFFSCKVGTAKSQRVHLKPYELSCKATIWLFSEHNIK